MSKGTECNIEDPMCEETPVERELFHLEKGLSEIEERISCIESRLSFVLSPEKKPAIDKGLNELSSSGDSDLALKLHRFNGQVDCAIHRINEILGRVEL